jgi:hypothetical protein
MPRAEGGGSDGAVAGRATGQGCMSSGRGEEKVGVRNRFARPPGAGTGPNIGLTRCAVWACQGLGGWRACRLVAGRHAVASTFLY